MSNILEKDRKSMSEKLKALVITEATIAEFGKFINNESIIPKKKRDIATRSLNKIIDAYTNLKVANQLGDRTKAERTKRRSAGYNAEVAIKSFIAELRLYPYIIPGTKKHDKWYGEIMAKAVEADKLITGFRIADEKRLNKLDSKEKEENIKLNIKKKLKIPFKFVNREEVESYLASTKYGDYDHKFLVRIKVEKDKNFVPKNETNKIEIPNFENIPDIIL